jgi:hypothetical protein
MDLREIGWGSVKWIQLAQDRDRWRALVNTVMNLRVLSLRTSLVGLLNSHLVSFVLMSIKTHDTNFYYFLIIVSIECVPIKSTTTCK